MYLLFISFYLQIHEGLTKNYSEIPELVTLAKFLKMTRHLYDLFDDNDKPIKDKIDLIPVLKSYFCGNPHDEKMWISNELKQSILITLG